jgi:hypothetical protein
MSTISGYEGPSHPLSAPIEALTAVSTAEYNHRAVGIRNCENAFHLDSTILGSRDIVEEFVVARIWPISHGWAPNEIVHFNVIWAAQEVPFPKFGIELGDGQSADDFMLHVEKRVNLMIGEYTMNEYKAYKSLVKHKKRINRVFSEACGDKSFNSRRPGRKLKIPAVAVASCSAAPLNAPRRRSSKSGPSVVDETTSSGVQPSKTRSLESSKRKRRTSERISDAELQAASGLAQMSRKKSKKAVKKVISSGVRRVPSAFDDDVFIEPERKGSFFWPLLRFDFLEHFPSGSESEFVDIDSFSDVAPEVRKEIILDAAAGPSAAAPEAVISQHADPVGEASVEFIRELELTIHRDEDPVANVPLFEVRKSVPEGQDPSPSVAAFHKSFGTSHCGELLSVGCEVTKNRDGIPWILTLWESPALIDETGEEGSDNSLEGIACDSRRVADSSQKKASASVGKSSSSSGKKVIMKNYSRQGSSLFLITLDSHCFTISCL